MANMRATAKNEKTARDIINVLAENGCTVGESNVILNFVKATIENRTTVTKLESKLFETEKD